MNDNAPGDTPSHRALADGSAVASAWIEALGTTTVEPPCARRQCRAGGMLGHRAHAASRTGRR